MEPLPPTTCPNCLTVRQSQGFHVTIDPSSQLCEPCAKWQADRVYFESQAYQSWFASMPQGITMEEMREWMTSNPPPSRESPT